MNKVVDSAPILTCSQLTKTYSDGTEAIHVLRGITLTVHPADWVAILGQSGSGKSTLLHILGGLDQPTTGQVCLNGRSLYAMTEKEKCNLRNRCLGFVYQFHYLLPEFSALENVSMPLFIRNDHTVSHITNQAMQLLEQVGLKDRLYHRPSQLSGGERQRVAIARALITEPLCILADEPTGNLDAHNAEQVLTLFATLQQTHQTSIIMVTHDHTIAQQAKRLFTMEQGRLAPVVN